MNSKPIALVAVWGILVLGCQRDRAPSAPAPATELCGLPVEDLHQVSLRPGPDEAVVQVTGPVGSFRIDNMASTQQVTCKFQLHGPQVTAVTIFSRYGSKDGNRVQLTRLAPGQFRVRYTIPGRSYGLISVEPPVQAPKDPTRFERAGVRARITGGALLRYEDQRPWVRSLGPATGIQLENTTSDPAPLDLTIDNTSDRLSRVVLEGLENGQAHRTSSLRLRITGSLPAGGKARVALEPRPLTPPWSFLFGGDIKAQLGIFVQLLEQVRLKHDPLFMIGAGDYTRNSLPQELDAYLTRTADLPFPVYAVKGNHELRAQGQRHYPRLFGPDRFAFTVGNALFVVLDGTHYERQGEVSGFVLGADQLAWLDRVLTEHQALPLKFVALHPPPHPLHGASLRPDYPSNMLPGQAAKLMALSKKHAVTHVLSGHAHLYARAAIDGTVYLTSGGGGAKLWSHNALEGFTIHTRKHLMVMTVTAAGVEEHQVDLPRSPKP